MTTPERCEVPTGHGMVFDLDEQAKLVEVGDDALAGDVAVESVVFRAGEIDGGGRREDVEAGEVVALADGEVVGVVRGRDLNGTGAELGVGPVVGDDGNLATGEGQGLSSLAEEVLCSARRLG